MASRPRRPTAPPPVTPPVFAPLVAPPLAASSRGRTTGRYLVLTDTKAMPAAKKALEGSGLTMSSVSGTEALLAPRSMDASTGLIFPDLGVAIINALPDQYAGISAAVASTDALQGIEPERYVYAMPAVDGSYLKGYRDAVNQLVDTLLGGQPASRETGSTASAAAFTEESTSWGLQATNVVGSRFTGKGVRIAVLDTGLDLTHADFAGRVQLDTQSQSFVAGVTTVQDDNGHGTHCAGVASGPAQPSRLPRFAVAPDADLYIAKVLDQDGSGTDADILGGLQWAITAKCEIVSMSLGGPVDADTAFSQLFEQAAQRALALGCLIFAAAGNDSQRPDSVRPVSHPANCPSIVAVAAVDQSFNVAPFSNGSLNPNAGQIDLAGPGVDVISDWPSPLLYKLESGTSMATPHVAGIAALYAEANPNVRGTHLLGLMLQGARRLPAPSTDVGSGLVQAP